MSIPTLLGTLFGFILFVGSILWSDPNIAVLMLFVDVPSLVMVVGGTFASTFMAFEPRYVSLALRNLWRIMQKNPVHRGVLQGEVKRIIQWGYTAQTKGIPAFEAEASGAKADDLTKFAVQLVASGYKGEEVKEILHNAIEMAHEREIVPVDVMKFMAAASPAFGMVGTLVGLILMLKNMGSDTSALGPAMALALITTLYGVMMARMVFLPAANKVQQRAEILRFRNYLIVEGLALLADRKSPRYIQDRMNSFLDPSLRFDIDKQGTPAPAKKG